MATCGDKDGGSGDKIAPNPVTDEACNEWCIGRDNNKHDSCVYNAMSATEQCTGTTPTSAPTCSGDQDMGHCCKPDGNTLTNKVVTIPTALHLTGVSKSDMDTDEAKNDFKTAVGERGM